MSRPLKVIIVLAAILLCGATEAMVVVQRDFPELVERAELIVVGTVSDIKQQEDEAGAPSTFVTFSDLTVLKGEVGETVTLRFYGGASGGVVVSIPDMPSFTAGERDVLFVAGNGRDICPLVGVWQGRFHVRFDSTRSTEVVEDDARRPVVGLESRRLRRVAPRAGTDGPAPLTLDEFRQLIAAELAHPHGTESPR